MLLWACITTPTSTVPFIVHINISIYIYIYTHTHTHTNACMHKEVYINVFIFAFISVLSFELRFFQPKRNSLSLPSVTCDERVALTADFSNNGCTLDVTTYRRVKANPVPSRVRPWCQLYLRSTGSASRTAQSHYTSRVAFFASASSAAFSAPATSKIPFKFIVGIMATTKKSTVRSHGAKAALTSPSGLLG